MLATLVRTLGSRQLAEDAVQDAALAALRAWPRTGVPEDPRAWLTVTARNKAYDALRREAARPAKETTSGWELPRTAPDRRWRRLRCSSQRAWCAMTCCG